MMSFENLEQANDYQLKAEKEIADLKQQLESQKSVLSEKDETIKIVVTKQDGIYIFLKKIIEQKDQYIVTEYNSDGSFKSKNFLLFRTCLPESVYCSLKTFSNSMIWPE